MDFGVGAFGCHESVPPPQKKNFVAAPLTVREQQKL